MPERRRRSIPGAAVALGLLGLFVLMALLAPLLANDKPILARVDGRMLTPALADLPLVGALFEPRAGRLVSWDPPGPGVVTLLRPPVPYSYRGIRLEMALVPPSSTHLMGTDALGRDLLARLIHGSRASLAVGLMATTLALMLGTLLGLTAALRGGLVDLVLVRVADAVASFPPIVLALAFVAASGRNGLGPIVASIALSRWTAAARFVRGETLRHASSELWVAARSTGASVARLALRHLLPLLAPPLAVLAAFGVAHAILLESSLSFLGLGVAPPIPSWGGILAEARANLGTAWWPVLFPSAALLLVLGSLCLAGEAAAEGGARQGGSRR